MEAVYEVGNTPFEAHDIITPTLNIFCFGLWEFVLFWIYITSFLNFIGADFIQYGLRMHVQTVTSPF